MCIRDRSGREGVELLDLKTASESLVVAYRERVLFALGIAALLLVATVWVALRTPRRVLRVLLPMALTTLITVSYTHLDVYKRQRWTRSASTGPTCATNSTHGCRTSARRRPG